MKGSQRIALSLLISIVLSSVIVLASYAGIFDLIETKFFNNQVIKYYQTRLDNYTQGINTFHDENIKRINSVFEESRIWRNFLSNQSREVITETRQGEQFLSSAIDDFIGIRLVDNEGAIHYSNIQTDKKRELQYQIVYSKISEVQSLFSDDELAQNKKLFLGNEDTRQFFVYKIQVTDAAGQSRGYGLVYVGLESLNAYLIKNGLYDVGKKITLAGRSGLILNSNLIGDTKVVSLLEDSWKSSGNLEPVRTIARENDSVLHVFQESDSFGYHIGLFVLDSSFSLSNRLKLLLLVSSCVSVFLLTFLLINLKQDDSVVFESRLKRFHETVFTEYIENQDSVPLEKWFRELSHRKSQIKDKLVSGLKKEKRTEFEVRFDQTWDQLVSAFQSQAAAPSLPDTGKLEELLNKVLQSQLSGVITSSRPISSSVTDASPRKESRASAVNQVKGKKDAKEIGSTEEIEAVEEIGSVEEIEDAEEIETVEEIGSVEEIEEAEEIEAVEEIGSVEEIEEAEDIEAVEEIGSVEEIEDAEEIEAVEEIGSVEEIEETEEIEAVEDIGSVEEIEDAEEIEAVEEIENAEETTSHQEVKNQENQNRVTVSFVNDSVKGDIPVLEYTPVEYELVRIGLEKVVEPEREISAVGYSMMNPETIIDDDEVLDLTALFSGTHDLGNIEVFDENLEDAIIADETYEEVESKEIYESGEDIELLEEAVEEEEIEADITRENYVLPLPPVYDTENEMFEYIEIEKDDKLPATIQELGRADIYKHIETNFSYGLKASQMRHSYFDDTFENRNMFADLDVLISKLKENDGCEIYHLSEVKIHEDQKQIAQYRRKEESYFSRNDDITSLSSDLTDLVDSILPLEKEEDLSIDSILSFKSVDLSDGMLNETEPFQEDIKGVFSKEKKSFLKMQGFDFDMYCSSIRQGSMSTIKGIMKLSAKFNAFYAAILKFSGHELKVSHSLGMDSLSISQLVIKADQEEFGLYKNRLIIYLRKGRVGIPFFDSVLVGRDQAYLKGVLYFPIIYNNEPAYLFLGLKNSEPSIEEWVSKLNQV